MEYSFSTQEPLLLDAPAPALANCIAEAVELDGKAFAYENYDFAMSYVGESFSAAQSPQGDETEADACFSSTNTPTYDPLDSVPKCKKRTKRVLTNPVHIERRREQNRRAQGAYRRRKETRIKELEDIVETVEQQNKKLLEELEELRHTSEAVPNVDVDHLQIIEAKQEAAEEQARTSPGVCQCSSTWRKVLVPVYVMEVDKPEDVLV